MHSIVLNLVPRTLEIAFNHFEISTGRRGHLPGGTHLHTCGFSPGGLQRPSCPGNIGWPGMRGPMPPDKGCRIWSNLADSLHEFIFRCHVMDFNLHQGRHTWRSAKSFERDSHPAMSCISLRTLISVDSPVIRAISSASLSEGRTVALESWLKEWRAKKVFKSND